MRKVKCVTEDHSQEMMQLSVNLGLPSILSHRGFKANKLKL